MVRSTCPSRCGRTLADWNCCAVECEGFKSPVFIRYNRGLDSTGEVAEWSNVPDSKSGVLAIVPRVRIPPSPPRMAPQGAIFLPVSPPKNAWKRVLGCSCTSAFRSFPHHKKPSCTDSRWASAASEQRGLLTLSLPTFVRPPRCRRRTASSLRKGREGLAHGLPRQRKA